MFVDEDGRPITVQQWAHKFEDLPGRTLASDHVEAGTLMTVWVGMVDHTSCCRRAFSTGWSTTEGAWRDVEHYDTKADAEHGHARHLASLRAGRPLTFVHGDEELDPT